MNLLKITVLVAMATIFAMGCTEMVPVTDPPPKAAPTTPTTPAPPDGSGDLGQCKGTLAVVGGEYESRNGYSWSIDGETGEAAWKTAVDGETFTRTARIKETRYEHPVGLLKVTLVGDDVDDKQMSFSVVLPCSPSWLRYAGRVYYRQ